MCIRDRSIRDAERKLGTPRDKRCKVIMISALDEGFDASYASDDYEPSFFTLISI